MMCGGTTSATLRIVGGKRLLLTRFPWAFVVGKGLIVYSPFAGGWFGASSPSLTATNSLSRDALKRFGV